MKGPSGTGEQYALTDEEFQQKNENVRKDSNEDARIKRKCYHKSQIPSMCVLIDSVSLTEKKNL